MSAPSTTALDGRRKRSEASRERVADALLELLREGKVRPSADAVAQRAGVSRRTVFNRFRNLGGLARDLHERQFSDVRSAMPALPEKGTLEQRLAQYLPPYAVLLESVAPVRAAALTFPGSTAERQQLAVRVRQVHALLSSGPLQLLREAGVTLRPERQAAVLALAFEPTQATPLAAVRRRTRSSA